MARFEGKKAVLKIDVDGTPTQFGEARSYDLEIEAGTIDAPVLSTDWKTFLRGQRSWSGTIQCWYDPADPSQAELESRIDQGEDVHLTFFDLGEEVGKPKKSGNAIITRVRTSVATEEAVGLEISFQGNGPLVRETVTE